VPKKLKSKTALMIIGGGNNKDAAPKGGDIKIHTPQGVNSAIGLIQILYGYKW